MRLLTNAQVLDRVLGPLGLCVFVSVCVCVCVRGVWLCAGKRSFSIFIVSASGFLTPGLVSGERETETETEVVGWQLCKFFWSLR